MSCRGATRVTDLTGFTRAAINHHFCMDTSRRQSDFQGNLSGLNLYDWDNLLLAYRKASKSTLAPALRPPQLITKRPEGLSKSTAFYQEPFGTVRKFLIT